MSFTLFLLLTQVPVLTGWILAFRASWCLRTRAHYAHTVNASPGEIILLAGPSEPWNLYNCRFLCLSVSSDVENCVQRCKFLWTLKAKNVVPFFLQRRVIFSCSWSYEVLLLNKDFEVQKKGEYSSRDDFWTKAFEDEFPPPLWNRELSLLSGLLPFYIVDTFWFWMLAEILTMVYIVWKVFVCFRCVRKRFG